MHHFTFLLYILLSLHRGDNVLLLLLDLSAAFDTANHSYFTVWRTRLASRELFCSGSILICLADLILSKLMMQN